MRKTTLIGLAVVLGAALALGGCAKPATKGTTPASSTTEMRVLIITQPSIPESAYAFKKGDVVRIKNTGVTVGTIESVEVTAALKAIPTAEGGLVAQPSPIDKEVRLTVTGPATVSGGAYIFPGGQLYVTTDAQFVTPTVQFSGAIVTIEPKAN